MKKITHNHRVFPLCFSVVFLLFVMSCDYGELGGADVTDEYRPGGEVFEERLAFLSGVWYSQYPGIGRLDGYRVRRWDSMTAQDTAKLLSLFPGLGATNYRTYATGDSPQPGDYILLYDDTVYGQVDDDSKSTDGNWGFAYAGIVRAITIFSGDIKRGAIIIEYFEGADPNWLWDINGYAYQGLARGEKPFFGIYFKVLEQDTVQMANAVDLAALYAGEHYYTEKATLAEAIAANGIENEAEYISWGVVTPLQRQ